MATTKPIEERSFLTDAVVTIDPPKRSALATLANRMGSDPSKTFQDSLRLVAFNSPGVTNEQLLALCVVANQYGLNPFTKELYAFPSKGGIVPIVSVDGWARIMNEQPSFDGMEFVEDEAGAWIECVIYRKDRSHPLRAREHLVECKRPTDPWRTHPRRMLRHKAMIQAARMAFGFAGIYDPDEADRILQAQNPPEPAPTTSSATNRLKAALGVTVDQVVPAATTEPEPEPEPPTSSDDWLKGYSEPGDAAG